MESSDEKQKTTTVESGGGQGRANLGRDERGLIVQDLVDDVIHRVESLRGCPLLPALTGGHGVPLFDGHCCTDIHKFCIVQYGIWASRSCRRQDAEHRHDSKRGLYQSNAAGGQHKQPLPPSCA